MRLIDADALMKCIPYEDIGSRMAIANAPTIEPERKTGKWIREPYSDEGVVDYVVYRCGNCLKPHGIGDRKIKWYKFCPNCGARMEGEE